MADEKKTRRRGLDDFVSEETLTHAHNAREEWRKSWEALLPPGFVEHRRAARREMLLAARSVIDTALEKIETAGKQK
ncbi:MAG: hypothetical protein HY070_09985 [Chloroflexi bacterium]|nr:hypothetical protein [Chloroflexota bacterium]